MIEETPSKLGFFLIIGLFTHRENYHAENENKTQLCEAF